MLGRSLAIEGEAGRVSPMPDAAVMVPAQAEETRKPRPAPVAEVPKAAGDDRRQPIAATERRLSSWGEPVDRAIRKGVRLLIQQQLPNGSWFDLVKEVKSGSTSLAALALLAAGEEPDSPTISKALGFLRGFGPDDLNNTYAIALQTMVYAAAEPKRDRDRIAANVRWLEGAQIKPEDRRALAGDLDLLEGQVAGRRPLQHPVRAPGPQRRRRGRGRRQARGLGAVPAPLRALPGPRRRLGLHAAPPPADRQHDLRGDLQPDPHRTAPNSGPGVHPGGGDPGLRPGHRQSEFAARHELAGRSFPGGENFGSGQTWKFYYLYGLERAGRLVGLRNLGAQDWYRLGAEELVQRAGPGYGGLAGRPDGERPVVATSFALLFLAKGRAPVLIHKLRHRPPNDWNTDPADVGNLVDVVGRDWKHLLTWQLVDPGSATVPDLLRAPILFLNGHRAPSSPPGEKESPRVCRPGRFPLRRGLLRRARLRPGFPAVDEGHLPGGRIDAPTARRGPSDPARQSTLDSAAYPLWGIRRGLGRSWSIPRRICPATGTSSIRLRPTQRSAGRSRSVRMWLSMRPVASSPPTSCPSPERPSHGVRPDPDHQGAG